MNHPRLKTSEAQYINKITCHISAFITHNHYDAVNKKEKNKNKVICLYTEFLIQFSRYNLVRQSLNSSTLFLNNVNIS